ncbi:hypothetical protein L226DRAFT_474292, partial [Lentinus tigrinus ALCF2SS1-7]
QNRLRKWLPSRQDFLDELVAFEGGDEPIEEKAVICEVCGVCPANIRCRDCFGSPLRCKQCVLAKHAEHLLHRIETWDGEKFVKTSLEKLGLKVQVSHRSGTCPHPSVVGRQIVICDSTGVFTHRVRFCKCIDPDAQQQTPEWRQLMRMGWFPATMEVPKTVFTFRLLKTFQELNFQAKTNLYDYWKSIERITDNSGGTDVPNRYKQFSHTLQIWRHLVMLKRFARTHDPAGAGATASGELVVECPACPHPGKNLPDGWEKAPAHSKWLYTLYLMIDANFRARCKDRRIDDVELALGWAYYVEETAYQVHVAACKGQKEENSCSAEHNAILKANLRREGYVASGIGAVLCARHALVRKNGAGDLQLGEGYANMNYLVFSTVLGLILASLLFSYDIVCQWCKNFFKRMDDNFPPAMRIDRAKVQDIRFAIPKKHYRVHGGEPHSRWSLNYLKHVGRTYGEWIEAHWSHMNPLALSTREMGQGMRHETYNDHWGAWNWQKTISFGSVLLRVLQEAREMRVKQRQAYQDFVANISADTVKGWEEMLDAWHADPNQPDPYDEPTNTISLAAVKLQLNKEEAAEAAAGALPPHDATPGVFLQVGLELEEKQCVLPARNGRSLSELATQQEKRNVLMPRIELWREIQDVHMPRVAQLRAADLELTDSDGPRAPIRAEDACLWLPSALPPAFASNELLSGLRKKEQRLRLAQLSDALAEIRRIRRVLAAVSEFSRMNVVGLGQRLMTRQQGLYKRFQEKQKRAAERYRAARTAMVSLNPTGSWVCTFKPLLNSDLRGPRREDDEIVPSEGRYEPSWIWLTSLSIDESTGDRMHPADSEEFLETMRAEWARSKARADRWDEEERLLLEEMRRVIEYFQWKSRWWRTQATGQPNVSARLQRGLRVYAYKQAAVYTNLARRTASTWVHELASMGPLPEWIKPYEKDAKKVHPSRRGGAQSMQDLMAEVVASGDVSSSESSDDEGADE